MERKPRNEVARALFGMLCVPMGLTFLMFAGMEIVSRAFGWRLIGDIVATFLCVLAALLLVRWHGNGDNSKTSPPSKSHSDDHDLDKITFELPCDAEREMCPVPCRQCPIYRAFVEKERDAGRAPVYEPTDEPGQRVH